MRWRYLVFLLSLLFIPLVSSSGINLNESFFNNSEMNLTIDFSITQAFSDKIVQDTLNNLYFVNLTKIDGGESITFNITERNLSLVGQPLWFNSSNLTHKSIGSNLSKSLNASLIISDSTDYGSNCENVNLINYTSSGNTTITFSSSEAVAVCQKLIGEGYSFVVNPGTNNTLLMKFSPPSSNTGPSVGDTSGGSSGATKKGGDTQGPTDIFLCNYTYDYINENGIVHTGINDLIIKIEEETGEDYSFTDIRRYVDNWQVFCSEDLERSLNEKLVCDKAFFTLVDKGITQKSLSEMTVEIRKETNMFFSEYLARIYLEEYSDKCPQINNRKLPREPLSLALSIPDFNFPDCEVNLDNTFFDAYIPWGFSFSQGNLTCSNINTQRFIFKMEQFEDVFLYKGLKVWFVAVIVLILISISLFALYKMNKKKNKRYRNSLNTKNFFKE